MDRTHPSHPRGSNRIATLAAALGTALLAACGGTTASGAPAVEQDVARIRAVTTPFHVLDSAVAAGYAREVRQCLSDAEHGAMGYHHVNRALVDDVVEVERPEILLYERMPTGDYRLNGVEYVVPYRVRPRDAEPPTVMGQSLRRSDPLELWYLHAWVWTGNPAGLFADWNPVVKC